MEPIQLVQLKLSLQFQRLLIKIMNNFILFFKSVWLDVGLENSSFPKHQTCFGSDVSNPLSSKADGHLDGSMV